VERKGGGDSISSDAEIKRLKDDEGLSIAQIEQMTGKTTAQVKHALRRARGLGGGDYGGHFDTLFKEKTKQGFEERKPRVFKDDDVYTVVSGGRNQHTVKISEDALRQLKKYYCLEKLTINQLCREMRLPRRDFYLIKTAFGITKDDAPYIDEDLINNSGEELAVDSLQEKKRLYFVRLQQREVDDMRKELNKYRQQDFLQSKIHAAVSEHMKEVAGRYTGPAKSNPIPQGEYMLEIPIVDLHLGKLAWFPETGENYDYKIARQRYQYVIDDVCTRAQEKRIEKILFPIGQDFFHFDTTKSTTTAGTPLDSDLRWQKMFSIGVEMLVWSIDRVAEIAPVEVVGIPGNHDLMTLLYAVMYLSAWYKDNDRVTVSTDPSVRKYFEYGNNLIGYTHGDKERGRIFGNMQVEAPKAWGRTLYREFHTGHLHSEQVKEANGVIVRSLSSITGRDSWHFESGYTGAIRKQQSFLWHKEDGLCEVWHTPIK
jgi:hypothetical protein